MCLDGFWVSGGMLGLCVYFGVCGGVVVLDLLAMWCGIGYVGGFDLRVAWAVVSLVGWYNIASGVGGWFWVFLCWFDLCLWVVAIAF